MIERKIHINGKENAVDLKRPFLRYPHNPVLAPSDVNQVWTQPHRQVMTVHNAGVARHENEIIMLFRSHLKNGISVIGMARSRDGITGWAVDDEPALRPCVEDDIFAEGCDFREQMEREAGGVEDPRITKIGDKYFVTYSAYHGFIEDRVRVCVAVTEDFKAFTRLGPILDKDMRNVVIFPGITGGNYYALLRPNDDPSSGHTGGIFREIRLARTKDPESNEWEILPDPIMKQSGGPSPFQHKIGPGAPPLLTPHGWLNIFHGVRSTMDGNPYVLGVALHDPEDPSGIVVSSIPLVFPTKADCKVGEDDYIHVPHVVFSCGALRQDDGTIVIYYGGNDTVMNVGFSHEDILAELCRLYPQDPLTGVPLYKV